MHGKMHPERTDPPRVFPGWRVVAAAFAVTFVGFGCVYAFTAFFDSLQQDFGASRGSVSVVFSLAGFLYFGLGSVSGPLADRFGARALAVTGMALVGLGLAAVAAACSLAQVYAIYALAVGIGVGLAYVPAMGTVQRWFVRHRALASGIASSGIGAGTLVVPPLASLLVAHLGWRPAYVALGITAAIVGAGMALMLADDPRAYGLVPRTRSSHDIAAGTFANFGFKSGTRIIDLLVSFSIPTFVQSLRRSDTNVGIGTLAPDGDPLRPDAAAQQPDGATLREALTSRRFVYLYGACLACSIGVFVPFVHLSPYAIDHGMAKSSAVLLVSAIGIGSTVGRFLLGGLADRLGHARTLVATYLVMAASLVIWLTATTFWPLALFGFIFGSAYGGWVALQPPVVMGYFGGRNISGVIGILYTSAGIGTLLGPSAAGFAYDVSHSYTLPILVSIGGNLVAAVLMALAARGPRPAGSA